MFSARQPSLIHTGGGRSLSRSECYTLLDTYNCYLKDKTHLHLTVTENTGEVTVEGILVVSWGVRRPIRLKIQDEKQMLPSDALQSPVSPLGGKRGMIRWGEWDDLYHIDELEETEDEKLTNLNTDYREYETSTLKPPRSKPVVEETSNLFRTMSDAALVKKRVKSQNSAERQRNRKHRFSINGHFYNYKTSIFTPSYGTTTNVHINSRMTTHEVITQLLQKFKIENDPNEFALYCIHQSGEKRKLGSSDFPLWERILQGPSEEIMNIFLMDKDEQEVSLDVAQYLNLELPLLEGVLQKLEEQENEEIEKLITKYSQQRSLLTHCLNSKITPKTETTV
ncbi:ras association domain-containing protein 6 [Chanos chanos]|uniref:Ras association domain-containing protein 6 n=1 Tax=Chanos chanos TaxID=29144 RepID=A0A6J2UVJ0_CHACN|nr:ras association domain-containing protein 6 [Chanos chanos]